MYIQYNHHGRDVWVDEDNAGKHRELCLCWSCKSFYPDNKKLNCPYAKKVFGTCVEFGLVTPVLECPAFMENK